MTQFALQALDSTQRSSISYADVRVAESRDRELATKNRRPGQVSGTESAGLGIRALADGCWGFAATDDLSKSGVESATTARSSGLARTQDVALAVIFQNTVEP